MTAISVLVVFATLITIGLTFAGSLSMAKTGPCDGTRSATLMSAKVASQAVVIGMLVIGAVFWN